MATVSEVAEHLDVSEETIRQLKRRGVLHSAARGQMDVDSCRLSYIRHLREQAAGRRSDAADAEGFDIVKERARMAAMNADRAEMRNRELRGELVPVSAVTSAVVNLVELCKAQLMKIGSRVAGGDARLRVRIEKAVEDALEELTLTRVEESTGRDDSGDEDAE